MKKIIAFLRAINVGGHNVKMDDLRGLFSELGLQNVESFIASGNIIFDPPAGSLSDWENRIAAHLEAQLGFPVETFLRSNNELARIASREPFDPATHSETDSRYIAFLAAALPEDAVERLLALRSAVDDFAVLDRELYWLRRNAKGESSFSNAVFEKTTGVPATFRNMNTLRRLLKKYPPDTP